MVIGVYLHHMLKVEVTYKNVKANKPERFQLYRTQQRRAFNHLLFSLDMEDVDIEKPMTDKIYKDPSNP